MAVSACKTPITPGSLDWCSGQLTSPGIRLRVYYIPKRDIVLWPKLPAPDSAEAAALAIYTGSFKLAAEPATKWKFIRIDQKKSNPVSDPQGEPPFATYLDKGTFVHPGTGEQAAAFARQACNDDYVYLFEQIDGKFRVIGNEAYETATKVSTNLGQVGGTDKGTTIEASCTSECPLPFYTGEIITEEGIINPVTPAT